MQSFGACGGCALFCGHESTCPAENNSGHHIIATSADHSLGLPMLLSLWCFGLFNNHVGPAHPLRPSQCCSPSSHSGYPPSLSRSRSIPVERSCCTTRVPRHVQRIQCACTSSPPHEMCMVSQRLCSDIDYSVCRFPLLASSSVFGSWRQVQRDAGPEAVCQWFLLVLRVGSKMMAGSGFLQI